MFSEFIKERQYLQNVSPRTIEWYRESFKWLAEPQPNQSQLKAFVIRMREKGLKPSSCNRIRAVNAYLQWLESDLLIPKLKEEQRVLPAFAVEDIKKLAAWKPKTFCQRRLQAIMLTLADTGTRIDKAPSLQYSLIAWRTVPKGIVGCGDRDCALYPKCLQSRRCHGCRDRSTSGSEYNCDHLA